ncbi:MAG: sulfotransferase [Xenococcaceae cyanobacterium MO_234.B1]|nr:sulfotransferase [Xenococcaceae cyanobacterium MO_234.B1]
MNKAKATQEPVNKEMWIQSNAQITDREFIEAAYLRYLKRKADPGGRNFYIDGINNQQFTREKIIDSLKSSNEYKKAVFKTNYHNFIILSSPRSGTHMLKSSLDLHPNIICHDEVFNPDYGYASLRNMPEDEILQHFIFREYKPSIKAVGFCLHRSDAGFRGNWQRLWNMLKGNSDLYVISLFRSNLLRRYLSFKRMIKSNVSSPDSKSIAIELDKNELLKDFQKQRNKVEEFNQEFGEHRILQVTYEQLCQDYSATIQGVQQFLEIPYVNLQPKTKKLETRSLKESIKNYEILKQDFSGTEWESFFED